MKVNINKRVYDTDTATQVGGLIRVQRCCNLVNVTIYKKRNGEYFLHCYSFPDSYFHVYNFMADSDAASSSYDDEYYRMVNGEFIIPLPTQEDVDYWLDINEDNNKELERLFNRFKTNTTTPDDKRILNTNN